MKMPNGIRAPQILIDCHFLTSPPADVSHRKAIHSDGFFIFSILNEGWGKALVKQIENSAVSKHVRHFIYNSYTV